MILDDAMKKFLKENESVFTEYPDISDAIYVLWRKWDAVYHDSNYKTDHSESTSEYAFGEIISFLAEDTCLLNELNIDGWGVAFPVNSDKITEIHNSAITELNFIFSCPNLKVADFPNVISQGRFIYGNFTKECAALEKVNMPSFNKTNVNWYTVIMFSFAVNNDKMFKPNLHVYVGEDYKEHIIEQYKMHGNEELAEYMQKHFN